MVGIVPRETMLRFDSICLEYPSSVNPYFRPMAGELPYFERVFRNRFWRWIATTILAMNALMRVLASFRIVVKRPVRWTSAPPACPPHQ